MLTFYILSTEFKNGRKCNEVIECVKSLAMWFRLGIQNFIAKKVIHDDCYELYISDFARIWHTSVSNDELVTISQRLNPLFEASVQKLKEVTSNLFHEEKAEKEITEKNDSIALKLKSNSLGVKFLFQIVLHKQNEEFFYKKFTLPLLLVLIQMQNREKKLIKVIIDKDTEIKEYKQECGIFKSNFVVTDPFNKEEFESQESVTNFCDINSLLECINSIVPFVNKEEPSCENVTDKCLSRSSQKCITDTKETIFMDKNMWRSGPKECVKLEHQTVKRRRKQTDAFKIKF